MKKNGFTLAEVLITLAIIGVVATMTLPALMTNTQEQQARTGLKKGINILTEAAQMHEANEGRNFASLPGINSIADLTGNLGNDEEPNAAANGLNSFIGLLNERTRIDLDRTSAAMDDNDVNNIAVGGGNGLGTLDDIIYFADGSAIIFDAAAPNADGVNARANDGLPTGFTVILDTNGSKGPNILSNCQGNEDGANDMNGGDDGQQIIDINVCNTRANRVIRDQFMLQLRGNVAVPRGAAALWTFNN